MEEKTSSKLKSMLDSKKIRNIIIVVGLIGIGLIFLSNWVDFGSLTSGKGDEALREQARRKFCSQWKIPLNMFILTTAPPKQRKLNL